MEKKKGLNIEDLYAIVDGIGADACQSLMASNMKVEEVKDHDGNTHTIVLDKNAFYNDNSAIRDLLHAQRNIFFTGSICHKRSRRMFAKIKELPLGGMNVSELTVLSVLSFVLRTSDPYKLIAYFTMWLNDYKY